MNLASLFWWRPFGRVPELAPSELARRLEREPLQLIDVRTPAEFARGHIAGARNAPITTFARRLPGLDLDPLRPVVAICLSAHRSIPAVRALRRAGHAEAYQLAGGMRAWRRSQLPEQRSC
jgi:rhodanese-related sulfurtransferase